MATPNYTSKSYDLFWNKVSITADDNRCWLWLGAKNPKGYGNKRWGNGYDKAHRIAWMYPDYVIPDGMCVLHSCDNPSCCNPKHLFLGTHQDNSDDMYSKGREARGEKVSNKGEKSASHKLTNEQIIEIRNRFNTIKISKSYLAKEFGVSVTMICRIIKRKNWVHI